MKKGEQVLPPFFSFSTKKEQHISPPSDVQAPNLTPKSELSMDAILANNISQNAEKVNSNYEKSSGKDEKRYSVSDTAYLPLAEKYQKGTVRSVRVLTPDGGEFELVKQKTEVTTGRGVTSDVALPIASVNDSISQSEQKRNTFSKKVPKK